VQGETAYGQSTGDNAVNKDEVLKALRDARHAHLKWVTYAEALLQGEPLEKEEIPLRYTDCDFGAWYYGEGQSLSTLPSFSAIAVPHTQLHTVYAQLFKSLYGEVDASLLKKLFGVSKKHQQVKLDAAARMLPELKAASKQVVAALDALEREVATLDKTQL
jgi:hypothetical protein